MSIDKVCCWILILAGIFMAIFTILIVADTIKYKEFQPGNCLIIVLGVGCGICVTTMAMLFTPYTNTVDVTDAVTVAEANKKYLVEKNGNLVDIDHYEKIVKHDDERYQLKTKTEYSITGREVGKTYTLVIPVDIIQEG